MQHDISLHQIGPQAKSLTEPIEKCVHCGFCLPACPTYDVMGEEVDSPRGRIFLMKEVLEGNVDLDEAAPFIDHCLGCVACETACPSGVEYGELLTAYRGRAETLRRRSLGDRLIRFMMLSTLPYPTRFRWAARAGRLAKPFAKALPRRLRAMLDLLPAKLPPSRRLPEVTKPIGERRARVALLATCAQQVLAPNINEATLRVLSGNGVEVVVPASQNCCGALAAHTGAQPLAQRLAIGNLKAFPNDVDAILTNAAGCGSGLHEYPIWLQNTEHYDEAKSLAAKVQDVSQFLAQLGLASTTSYRFDEPHRIAYHDACHLAHAQGVRRAPRELLGRIDHVDLVEIADDYCCGSAGTYNAEQPETASELGQRKAAAVVAAEVDAVASGNIGCITQLQTHLAADGPLVLHTIEILDRAMQGQSLRRPN